MLCLLLTALIWGFSFVSQVQGMDTMTPLFFNATRFTLGALSLLPVMMVAGRGRGRGHGSAPGAAADDGDRRRQGRSWLSSPALVGALCGVFLFSASTLQQYGIMFGRSAGRAGFITALYIVMVPLLAFVFLRRRITVTVAASVVVAIAGFYLLCITDGFGSLTLADALLLFTALLFAAHILIIDTLGARVDPLRLSFAQFVTTAALSWVGSFVEGSVDWAGAAGAWMPVLYAGVGSVGIAYTLQVVGQRWVPPTRASLLMSLESFFSVVGGALFLGEAMTLRGYLGCALIFAGTMMAQMPARLPRRRSGRPADRTGR
ncbi:transporter, drug/metabolite exporter family [Bifidobacterium sp. DSM 109958]|uniref:Transporter, drug/metabolite exporter family n=1 Tax=Bifidobacterium moraviense TaxID=2675323 RepID=A0A7Y0F1Q5_9BIFI|nr:DMT family transporter [Bifidobacterium sp. DSM 109958]NMN00391.1 transporter, drug/metabolite exporter family [Bifidobacterium sp. DSM 109958]